MLAMQIGKILNGPSDDGIERMAAFICCGGWASRATCSPRTSR